MNISEGYRIAKRLQQLGALGQEADRILIIRTIINQLAAPERAELASLVDRFSGQRLEPSDCTSSERRIIRAVIEQAAQRPRRSPEELAARRRSPPRRTG